LNEVQQYEPTYLYPVCLTQYILQHKTLNSEHMKCSITPHRYYAKTNTMVMSDLFSRIFLGRKNNAAE